MRIHNNSQKTRKRGLIIAFLLFTAFLVIPIQTVFGAEDPQVGTTNDDIENMIAVGKTLIGKTPYVYGGGHHDWEEQSKLDTPTGLDNSSFVAWVLYRGMGIDTGYAPISGNYENYFNTVNVGTLEGVKRGDLIVDDRHIEIYLGQDDSGKHYSLVATNDRNNVTITETNWGRGVSEKTVIRPSISEAKEGKNGLSYNKEVVIELWDEDRAIGSDQITIGDDTRGNSRTPEQMEKVKEYKEEKEREQAKKELEERDLENGEDSNTSKDKYDKDLYSWLDPIVDFSGTSNTHSQSSTREKRIDGNNKGLKGNKQGIFEGIFGGL